MRHPNPRLEAPREVLKARIITSMASRACPSTISFEAGTSIADIPPSRVFGCKQLEKTTNHTN